MQFRQSNYKNHLPSIRRRRPVRWESSGLRCECFENFTTCNHRARSNVPHDDRIRAEVRHGVDDRPSAGLAAKQGAAQSCGVKRKRITFWLRLAQLGRSLENRGVSFLKPHFPGVPEPFFTRSKNTLRGPLQCGAASTMMIGRYSISTDKMGHLFNKGQYLPELATHSCTEKRARLRRVARIDAYQSLEPQPTLLGLAPRYLSSL